jgi:choline dehydrogenase-like flavoprotein
LDCIRSLVGHCKQVPLQHHSDRLPIPGVFFVRQSEKFVVCRDCGRVVCREKMSLRRESQREHALSREPNTTIFQKTIALNDFYFGMDGFEYPMGNIQMIGKSLGPMYRGEKPLETALLPMGLLGDLARHAVDFWLSTEDLPDPENRVTVDSAGNLTLNYTPNNQVSQQKLYEKLKSMLGQLGMHPGHLIPRNIYMKTDIAIAGCAHQAGTCRFGTDAKSSVLDPNCKAHELDNLYVVDTSFFVSIMRRFNTRPLAAPQRTGE